MVSRFAVENVEKLFSKLSRPSQLSKPSPSFSFRCSSTNRFQLATVERLTDIPTEFLAENEIESHCYQNFGCRNQ